MLSSHVAKIVMHRGTFVAEIGFVSASVEIVETLLFQFQLVQEFVNSAFVSVSYSAEIGFEYHVTV